MKKILFSFIAFFLFLSASYSQAEEPINWKYSVKEVSGNEVILVFNATIDDKWHLYGLNDELNPFISAFEKSDSYSLKGKFRQLGHPHKAYDDLMEATREEFSKTAIFEQTITIISTEDFTLKGNLDYQACLDDGMCVMEDPSFEFSVKGAKELITANKIEVENKVEAENVVVNEIKEIDTPVVVEKDTIAAVAESFKHNDDVSLIDYKKKWYEPVLDQIEAFGSDHSIVNKSMWFIFIAGFIGGLIALLTPCVWPMIPMTVSFFIKQTDKGKGKRDALIYGLSIIVIYVILGLGVTLIFGADKLNEWSTSAAFNVFFFALLIVFAAAFLGAFELQLPSSWINKMDSKVDKTSGLISIFFMAFTLALVSFSCTGPIIGTLLVEAVQNGPMAPLVGMVGFSLALAIPFTLFAIFPSMMKAMPQSGGWLNSVKVVLGFLEIALALKFLSNADLAYSWGILDREVFLVLWIVLFTTLGFYLLGKLRFSHDSPVEKVGVGRFGLAVITLSFALYMVPGLWGAPLKAISAFSPPQFTQDFDLYDGNVHAKFDNYDEGMEYALEHNKPVVVDFTGWGCVNCRNMEASVWSDPRVKKLLEKDYVLISLYVDDRKELAEKDKYVSEISGRKIETVGKKWSELQFSKFGTQSQPYYFLLDNEGNILNGPEAYNLDVDNYIKFLRTGLDNYKEEK